MGERMSKDVDAHYLMQMSLALVWLNDSSFCVRLRMPRWKYRLTSACACAAHMFARPRTLRNHTVTRACAKVLARFGGIFIARKGRPTGESTSENADLISALRSTFSPPGRVRYRPDRAAPVQKQNIGERKIRASASLGQTGMVTVLIRAAS